MNEKREFWGQLLKFQTESNVDGRFFMINVLQSVQDILQTHGLENNELNRDHYQLEYDEVEDLFLKYVQQVKPPSMYYILNNLVKVYTPSSDIMYGGNNDWPDMPEPDEPEPDKPIIDEELPP